MAMRLKEDVRNEKIIRGLLKLPANKRCINCNSLGPQYVCTNFWTFICTNCSGIHREFTHRVKSVSMAKFTSQEVNALQEGGNERARELFFRDWDHQRNSFPDSSNVDKVRTFIKHVYVDRRYTGEGSADKPLRVKGDREDNERRRQEASLSGSRSPTIGSGSQSPQYDETHGRRHVGSPVSCGRNDDRNLRQNYGGKSPTYEQGRAEYRRSPGRLGVDTRLRDDKMPGANQTQTFEDSRLADGAGKTRSSSINFQNQKDLQIKSPIVRPVRDILGEDAPALVVGEPTKSSIPPTAQVFAPVQTSPNTTNISSSSINSLEPKRTALSSLIDFDIVGEHASAKNREEPVSQHVCTPNEENWASFDSVPVQKELQANTMLNSLDGTLDLLNGPGDTSVASATIIGTSSPSKTAAEHYARQQNEPSSFTNVTTASQSTISSLAQPAVETINSQGRPISDSLNTLETSATSSPAKSSNVPYDKQTAENPQPSQKMEAHSTGRKELPADLFAALYPNTHAPAMGWQTNPNNFAAGYGMQYPMPMVIPQFSYIPQPANPFDVSNQPRLPHSSTFPSMESLQGVLPSTINSSGLVRSSSFGANPLPQWMPQQQPGGYMGQHILGSTSHQNYINAFQMGNQGYGEATNQPPAFRPPIVEQHSDSRYSQPNTPSTFFSTSGNPFG